MCSRRPERPACIAGVAKTAKTAGESADWLEMQKLVSGKGRTFRSPDLQSDALTIKLQTLFSGCLGDRTLEISLGSRVSAYLLFTNIKTAGFWEIKSISLVKICIQIENLDGVTRDWP